MHLICIDFVSLLTKFHQNISSSCRDIEQRSSKKRMKIGSLLRKITPWRRQVGKNLMRPSGKEIFRRFRISNQIFGSYNRSRDIERSLDTTLAVFSKIWTLWIIISRTGKDFDMRFSQAAQNWLVLHSEQVSSKSLEPFLRKSQKTVILTTFLDFLDDPKFFWIIRLRHFFPFINV